MNWNIDPRTSLLTEESRTRNEQAAAALRRAADADSRARRAKTDAERAQTAANQQASAHSNDIRTIEILRKEAAENAKKIEAFQAAIKERDSLLLDWMHGHAAFKRLTKRYGNKLELSLEEIKADLREEVLGAAEENPDFVSTKSYGRATSTASQK